MYNIIFGFLLYNKKLCNKNPQKTDDTRSSKGNLIKSHKLFALYAILVRKKKKNCLYSGKSIESIPFTKILSQSGISISKWIQTINV